VQHQHFLTERDAYDLNLDLEHFLTLFENCRNNIFSGGCVFNRKSKRYFDSFFLFSRKEVNYFKIWFTV